MEGSFIRPSCHSTPKITIAPSLSPTYLLGFLAPPNLNKRTAKLKIEKTPLELTVQVHTAVSLCLGCLPHFRTLYSHLPFSTRGSFLASIFLLSSSWAHKHPDFLGKELPEPSTGPDLVLCLWNKMIFTWAQVTIRGSNKTLFLFLNRNFLSQQLFFLKRRLQRKKDWI